MSDTGFGSVEKLRLSGIKYFREVFSRGMTYLSRSCMSLALFIGGTKALRSGHSIP